jgi:hypothetical protein
VVGVTNALNVAADGLAAALPPLGFHLGELRRLGVSERGIMEILGVAQMFSSYAKIADTLQLESDMANLAPSDTSGVPEADGG